MAPSGGLSRKLLGCGNVPTSVGSFLLRTSDNPVRSRMEQRVADINQYDLVNCDALNSDMPPPMA